MRKSWIKVYGIRFYIALFLLMGLCLIVLYLLRWIMIDELTFTFMVGIISGLVASFGMIVINMEYEDQELAQKLRIQFLKQQMILTKLAHENRYICAAGKIPSASRADILMGRMMIYDLSKISLELSHMDTATLKKYHVSQELEQYFEQFDWEEFCKRQDRWFCKITSLHKESNRKMYRYRLRQALRERKKLNKMIHNQTGKLQTVIDILSYKK